MDRRFDIDSRCARLLSVILDTVDALVVVLDGAGNILLFNRACERLTGFQADEVRGQPVWQFLIPGEAEAVRSVFDRLKNADRHNRFENSWVGKDGSRHLIQWSNANITAADGSRCVIGTGIDITARRAAETAMTESKENLRRLAAQLIQSQEENSRRLAFELHDDFSQRLAALGIQFARIRSAPPVGSEWIDQMQQTVGRLAEDIHGFSRQLHPFMLEDLGLEVAMRSECRIFSDRYGVPVSCSVDSLPPDVPNNVSLGLYRIFQEALRNVGQHACASSVDVSIGARGHKLELSIQDTGVGFDVRTRVGESGIGLVGMRERARLIGAELSVASTPERGTIITARVPLDH